MSSAQPVPPKSRQRPRGKSSSGAQKPICSEVKAKLASWRSGAGPLNPKRKKETHWSTGSTEAEGNQNTSRTQAFSSSKYYSSPALNAKDTQLSECRCPWEQDRLL